MRRVQQTAVPAFQLRLHLSPVAIYVQCVRGGSVQLPEEREHLTSIQTL